LVIVNKLQQAYIDLGLQPGAPLEQVADRWRMVARMWHPDRAGSDQERLIAEAELKKVNGARDLISRHYQDGLHKLVGCECATGNGNGYAQEESRKEPPPPQSRRASGTSGATAKNGSARRKRRLDEPGQQAMAALLTAAMVVFGMFIVNINSGVRLRQDNSSYEASTANWRTTSGLNENGLGVRQSTLHALRPSAMNTPVPLSETDTAAADEQKAKAEEKKSKQSEKPATAQLPPNTSIIKFVSSDGRLVNLQDGTTWALWPQEAADSLFHWNPGDRVVVKGIDSSPCWLVNESRNFQAVQVTRVE
jgi:curved DNA-binding protein CbpA